MPHQPLYLCYSINDFFVREAGVSLKGFLLNNPDYEPEEVFFLDYGIHPRNKERLDAIASSHGKRITYVGAKPVTDAVRREYPQLGGWRGSMAPNAKAFIEQMLPPYVERLLFLDADTVVTGCVGELQALDMEHTALAAVPVLGFRPGDREAGMRLLSGNSVYFNSGVLLYNLAVWRREGCPQIILNTLRQLSQLTWPDQTLLNNAIPPNLFKPLPLKYNYMSHYIHPWQERPWLRGRHCYTKAEIAEAMQRPVVIHYLGGLVKARPWYEGCKSRRGEEYLRLKALTPWKDSSLAPPYQERVVYKGFLWKWYRCLFSLAQVQPFYFVTRLATALYYRVVGSERELVL